MTSTLPFIAFWFLYMAGLGVIFPYQSLYFHENAALAGTQLGLVLATRPLVGMFAQPFWGLLADRTGLRSRTLAVLALGTSVAWALFPQADTFPVLLAAMAFAALFSTSVMPMATSVSMASLGANAAVHFGRIRVWGTVGFLVLVVSFPWLLDWVQAARGLVREPGGPSEPGLELIFYVAAALALGAAVVAWRAPRSDAMVVRSQRGDLRLLLRHRPYRRLLYVVFLAHLCLQGPILFFPVFISARGGSIDTVSRMWIPMLLVEIPLIFLSGATLGRIGARGLLAVGVFADGFRWLVCSVSHSLPVLYALQLLHGVVVAGLFVGAALYVESVVPERLRSTGQGLLGMVGFSCAGMFSSLGTGWMLEHLGPDMAYRIGGAGALLLGVTLLFILPRPKRPEPAPDPR
jgi:PPP family 3-phenylpropionic acid transporter